MDQQAAHAARGRSPSAGHQQQPHIRNGHSPSPHPFPSSPEPNIGLGLGLESSPANVNLSQYNGPAGYTNFANGPPGTTQFLSPNQALPDTTAYDPSYGATSHPPGFSQNLLAAEFNGSGDFSLFSPSQGDQFNNSPLFGDNPAIGTPDLNNMTSPQTHHSPTPPHMLKPDPHHPGSAHQSPAFNQHQFVSPPPGQHSRHASLGPEAALLGGQVDWTQAQFQGHRRSPSEYSDISSAQHSPNLIAQDSFEGAHSDHGHSPMQRPQDDFYNGVSAGLGSFSISDPHINHPGRSPSHSPAMSPRIMPQPQMTDMGQPSPGFVLSGAPQGYNAAPSISYSEAFPTLPAENAMNQMAPPSINIDFAPNARLGGDMSKQPLDQTSLTPPERGKHGQHGDVQLHRELTMWQAARARAKEPLRTPTTAAGPDSCDQTTPTACRPIWARNRAHVVARDLIRPGLFRRPCHPLATDLAVRARRLGDANRCRPFPTMSSL